MPAHGSQYVRRSFDEGAALHTHVQRHTGNVAPSSADAELLGVVNISTEVIGLLQFAESWGMEWKAEVYADSSAALAVVARKGCGNLRHVRIGHLWVQEAAANGYIRYEKVYGASNPAYALTKSLPGTRIRELMLKLNQEADNSEAECRLTLQEDANDM